MHICKKCEKETDNIDLDWYCKNCSEPTKLVLATPSKEKGFSLYPNGVSPLGKWDKFD